MVPWVLEYFPIIKRQEFKKFGLCEHGCEIHYPRYLLLSSSRCLFNALHAARSPAMQHTKSELGTAYFDHLMGCGASFDVLHLPFQLPAVCCNVYAIDQVGRAIGALLLLTRRLCIAQDFTLDIGDPIM